MSTSPESVQLALAGRRNRPGRRSGFSWRAAVLYGAVLFMGSTAWAQGAAKFPGIGRAATEKEVKAWDIDVRPDFLGLPPGSGTVKAGQQIWEAQCASCHGVFGEATEVFNPLIGGTTAKDVKNGRVAELTNPAYPSRTTVMKLSTLSTLWDYINRAMPWNAPKSLSTDEVYSVSAYMLHLADVLPQDFTLSDKNMAAVQAMLPNRNGMITEHAMWPGRGLPGQTSKPDVQGLACMKDCLTQAKVSSSLPDYARNAHGNLAEQNRLVGAQRGADTSRPEPKTASPGPIVAAAAGVAPATPSVAPAPSKTAEAKVTGAPAAAAVDIRAAQTQAQKHGCTGCHAPSAKLVGPSWTDIAARHAGKADYLARKIKSGGSGLWGPIPMPAQALSEADAKAIAAWLASASIR